MVTDAGSRRSISQIPKRRSSKKLNTPPKISLGVPADRHKTAAVAGATGVVGEAVVGCGVEGFDVGAAVGAAESVGVSEVATWAAATGES